MTLTTLTDSYPDRIKVTVTGLTSGQLVSVTRTPAGDTTRVAVRGLDDATVTTAAVVRNDAELPFGVALTYILTVDEVDALSVSQIALSLAKVALSDAITGHGAEVVILAWPEKRTERSVSVFPIGGRNIVVSGDVGGFSSAIDVFVETDDSKNNVLDLIKNATSGVIQIRSDRTLTSDGVDCYVVPTAWGETRFSQDGSDERRVISMDVVESTSWGATLDAYTFSLADIAAAYPGGDLSDIAADYPGGTLLSIAIADFSS